MLEFANYMQDGKYTVAPTISAGNNEKPQTIPLRANYLPAQFLFVAYIFFTFWNFFFYFFLFFSCLFIFYVFKGKFICPTRPGRRNFPDPALAFSVAGTSHSRSDPEAWAFLFFSLSYFFFQCGKSIVEANKKEPKRPMNERKKGQKKTKEDKRKESKKTKGVVA